MKLTKIQARRFMLSYQRLLPPYMVQGKAGVMEYIRQVGCIQFDPLDVLGQNPALVLQARVRDFQPRVLSKLLYEDRLLLEGWDKMMAIYPVEDWRYFERQRDGARRSGRMNSEPVTAATDHVREEITRRGPLSSTDFESKEMVEWSWAPARVTRAALESLYFQGELVVHHRVHTRRYYDLSTRWIPPEVLSAPEPNPDEREYEEWYLLRRLGAVGLLWGRSGEAWLSLGGIDTPRRKAALERLVQAGRILPVEVEGIAETLYLRATELELLEASLTDGDEPEPQAVAIAPLDNMMWDRRLLLNLFDFDYRWEVYTPVVKRKYGYYVLPLLYGDRFIGRFEPVRQKRGGPVVIKNWWWEAGYTPDDAALASVEDCLRHLQRYVGVEQLEFEGPALSAVRIPELVERFGQAPE